MRTFAKQVFSGLRHRWTALVLLALCVPAGAVVPTTTDYQGFLADAAGVPVSGDVTLVFTLWDSEIGGNALWLETHVDVPVTAGRFHARLGSVSSPLTESLLTSGDVWLEINVDGETLAPRHRLAASPYAQRSRLAESVADGSVTASAIGEPCTDGEVLVKTPAGWTCGVAPPGPGEAEETDVVALHTRLAALEAALAAGLGGVVTLPPACALGESSCSNSCVDVATDANHCGACDNACAAGAACEVGVCGTPAVLGDGAFTVAFGQPPQPSDSNLDFVPAHQKVDVYPLIDRTGSMSGEINAVSSNLAVVLDGVLCATSGGSGDPSQCVPDLWGGIGGFGTSDAADGEPYVNFTDLQPNIATVTAAFSTTTVSGTQETGYLALSSTSTGLGSAATSCTVTQPYADRATCTGSPAGAAGVGYPCFRPDALRIALLITDEAPSGGFVCPNVTTTIASATAAGIRVIGITAATDATLTADLSAIATGTGAVDETGQPLVLSGTDTAAPAAIQTGILTLVNSAPTTASAAVIDDTSDGVDAVAAFVERIEVAQLGTAECSAGHAVVDNDSDTFPDTYLAVAPRTPICWRVVPKTNTTVAETGSDQVFNATLHVFLDGREVDSHALEFTVPAAP